MELPADKYTLVPPAAQQSHCQLEAHVNFSSVISHPCEGEWSRLAPFRILSVDIECQGRKVSMFIAGSTFDWYKVVLHRGVFFAGSLS